MCLVDVMLEGVKMEKKHFRVTLNSPVILGFVFLCFAALLINFITLGWANKALFSVYRSSLLDPLSYIRIFGHVLGHADWSHFSGNIMTILIIGPMLEEKYGSMNMLFIIVVTAVVTGLAHVLLCPNVVLLGASGVLFALILLTSFVGIKEKEIPVTLILVALFYIGGQIYEGLFVQDNVSNLTHILGGMTGSVIGFVMHKNKMNKY